MYNKVNSRFSVLEDVYPIAEQEICNNQQPYESPIRLWNKRRPQVVINHYLENDLPLQKDKENVKWTVPENSSYSKTVRYGCKSFLVCTVYLKISK